MASSLLPRSCKRLAALAAGLALAAGCAAGGGGDADAGEATPTAGGVLRIATADNLVPATIFVGTDTQATTTGLVYDTLVEYPTDGLEARPSLATSWTSSADGRTVTLTLRDDVTYHSGRAFTAEDVEFSLMTYADPRWSAQLYRTAAGITGFDTSEPHEITLTLAHPMGNLLDLLSIVPMLDRETFAQFTTGDNYVGTGAFRFVEWTPGAQLVYAANDDYWGGRPLLDRVELLTVTDPQAQVSQLRTGQVDMALLYGKSQVAGLDTDDDFTVFGFEGGQINSYLGTKVTHPALADRRLRQAMAYAIDRERIAADVHAFATPSSVPWAEHSPAYTTEAAEHYARDVEEARRLIAEVGTVPILDLAYTAGVASEEQTALIVQENLREIGVETRLSPVEPAVAVKMLVEAAHPALWLGTHTFGQYTPSTLAVSAYPFNAERNLSAFASPTYAEVTARSWQVADATSSAATDAYQELTDQILTESFVIELVSYAKIGVMSSDVHDVAWTKRNELDLGRTFLAR